jgi:peptide/nickel transport system substrate-binding protein
MSNYFRQSPKRLLVGIVLPLALAVIAAACASDAPAPAPQVITKEVIKIVEVEKPVEVIIEKVVKEVVTVEKVVEKIIVKDAPARPVPTPTTRPVPTPTPPTVIRVKTASGATSWVDQNAKFGGTLRYADRQAFVGGFDAPQLHSSRMSIIAIGQRSNRLVRYFEPDPSKALVGELAESWEFKNGGKDIVFHLRKGVKWHDGANFTSADVKATIDRMINPPAGVVSHRSGWFPLVTSTEAPDANTFILKMSAPFSIQLFYLANGLSVMAPKHVIEANNNDLSAVADWPGTGAFIYKEHTGQQYIKYTRNSNYWNGDLPFLDALEFHFIDQSLIGPALAAGRIDMSKLLNSSSVGIAKNIANVKSNSYSGFYDWHFHMNTTKKPFSDVRVRQALNMIYDRNTLREGILSVRGGAWAFGSKWVPGGSSWENALLPDLSQVAGFRPGGPTQADVDKANELMAAAGYANGLGTILCDTRFNLQPRNTIHLLMMQDSINKYLKGTTKIEMNLVPSSAESYARSRNNEMECSNAAFAMASVDHPAAWLGPFYQTGSGQNYSAYSSAEFDAVMAAIYKETDRTKAEALTLQAVNILEKDLPSIPAGIWAQSFDYWRHYVKGHNCEIVVHEHNQCIQFDTTWLDQ